MVETNPTQSLVPSPANDAWSITLKVFAGPHAGQVFSFDQHDTFLVGRSTQTHFCLPEKDPFFSRLHFLIEVNPPLCRLVDLKSHNGTLVNGQKVSSIDLKDGDEIRGGTTTLVVQIRAAASEEVPATAAPPNAPVSTKSFHEFPMIPGYRISKELGHGGMGVVYEAKRESDGRDVALKTIIPKINLGQDTINRFIREANILSQLQHPNIVAFQDMGQTGELVYFVMDLVAGTDASKLVKKEGPLPIGRAVRILLQVLDALTYAGEDVVVKIGDYGLAKTQFGAWPSAPTATPCGRGALTKRRGSGPKATALTISRWCKCGPSGMPAAICQNRAVMSSLPVNTVLLSRPKATAKTVF